MRIDRHHQFMWNFTKSLLFSFRRPVMIYLTSLSFTVMGLYSMAFFMAEGDVNPNLSGYFESLYFTVTVMTGVGLGDIAPMTTAGRVIAMIMMLSGTAIFVCFTATLSASIMDIEMNVQNQYDQKIKGD